MTERVEAPLEEHLREVVSVVTHGAPAKVDKFEFHDKLNGKQTPDITRTAQVFDMTSVPADAWAHPTSSALLRRQILKEGGPLADQIKAENRHVQESNKLATSGEVFKAPTPQPRRRA